MAKKEARKRRANADDGPRQHRLVVKLTDAELAELRGKAEAQEMSVQRLLLGSALGDEDSMAVVMRRAENKLHALEHQVSGVAANWNQIARKANTVHEVPANFEPALAEARALWFTCEEVIDEVVAAARRIGV